MWTLVDGNRAVQEKHREQLIDKTQKKTAKNCIVFRLTQVLILRSMLWMSSYRDVEALKR